MSIVINGSGTISGISVGGLPDSIVDAGTLATDSVTAAKLEVNAITHSDLPAGSVLQVVQATGNAVTNPSTSYADVAGSSIAITPSSSSSRVLFTVNAGGMSNGANNAIYIQILRGSTVIRECERYGYASVGWAACPIFLNYIDSPNTTSAVTYKVQAKTQADYDFRICDQDGSSNGSNGIVVTATEIAG